MDKIAVVTGGTKGIGKAIVCQLLSRGYYVFVSYANDSDAADIASAEFNKISCHFDIICADQTRKEDFYRFIDVIKKKVVSVNCIICNAGITVRKKMCELTDNDWEEVMQVSVNTHFYLIRELFPLIKENSRIIFIGSLLGIYPHATSLPYGVSKAAVHALAKNLVKEFEGTGTTVNVVVPGFVDTEWQKEKPQFIRDNIINKLAIKRFAESEEVASTCMFCIDNAYVNGSLIELSGGYCYK